MLFSSEEERLVSTASIIQEHPGFKALTHILRDALNPSLRVPVILRQSHDVNKHGP